MKFEPFGREMARRMFGVDTVPRPAGPREVSDRLESATAGFPRGSVLVDLDIDAEGVATGASVVDPPLAPDRRPRSWRAPWRRPCSAPASPPPPATASRSPSPASA